MKKFWKKNRCRKVYSMIPHPYSLLVSGETLLQESYEKVTYYSRAFQPYLRQFEPKYIYLLRTPNPYTLNTTIDQQLRRDILPVAPP